MEFHPAGVSFPRRRRPNKSARDRRAQQQRANVRLIANLLRHQESMWHRGNALPQRFVQVSSSFISHISGETLTPSQANAPVAPTGSYHEEDSQQAGRLESQLIDLHNSILEKLAHMESLLMLLHSHSVDRPLVTDDLMGAQREPERNPLAFSDAQQRHPPHISAALDTPPEPLTQLAAAQLLLRTIRGDVSFGSTHISRNSGNT